MDAQKPLLYAMAPPDGAAWAVSAEHPLLGTYHLYGGQEADLLYTENETNNDRLWGLPNAGPYVKDAFHSYLIDGESTAVNPQQRGTKFGAVHKLTVPPGQTSAIALVLSARPKPEPFNSHAQILSQRLAEANAFFTSLLPEATAQDHRILRQALAGMIWNKQFYHYDVSTWLKGDRAIPPLRG